MRRLVLALATGIVIQTAVGAAAEVYPSRPITMIVPFPAGGPSDVVGRIMADGMRRSLEQPVVVADVGGAGGTIGMGRVARAKPDGYTIGLGSWNTGVVNGAIYKLDYDVVADFEPVVLLPDTPLLIASKRAVPANNLQELIAWVKASGDKVLVGTAGVGTSSNVAGAMLQQRTGAPVRLVHYRGGEPALQELIAGHIDLDITQSSVFLPYLKDDRIRIYAVMAKTRLPQAPDVLTVDEAGLPEFYLSSWNGIWAPKRTPRDAIQKLNVAAVASLNDPTIRKRFTDLGQVIPTADRLTPEAFVAYQKAEVAKWWPIVKAAGIKAE